MRKTRTSIYGVHDREPVLADVTVRERHDVVHPMSRELLSTSAEFSHTFRYAKRGEENVDSNEF